LTTHVSGLTAWTGTVIVDAAGARIEMTYDLATQIPLTGSLSIPAGAVAFNAISPSAGFTPALDQLDNAGTFSNRGGAYAQIFGLDNQAGASLLNSGQLWTTGTTVNSGLITNRVGAVFESTGMINRGTIDNQGRFTSYGGFVNEPDGRFENRGTYDNEGFAQINNSGEFIVSGRVNNNASTLGPAYYTGSIRNTGRFTVQPGGIVTGSGTYFQVSPDAVTRVDGTLSASDITILNGTLSGSGTLVGPVALGNANGLGAVVQPGNSPGTLTIDGNLTAYYTTFEIELAGLSSFDRLVVDGSASFFGSQVIFSLTEGGYVPSIGDSFTWLTASGGTSGLGTLAWSIYVTSPGGVSSWQPPSGMEVAFYGDRIEFTTAPIPEPSTWVTLLAGLGLLGFATRRRCF
jgi:hypothetical protein